MRGARPWDRRGGVGPLRWPCLLSLVAVFTLLPPGAVSQETGPQEVHPDAKDAISKLRSPFCPGLMLEVCPSLEAQALRDSLNARAGRGIRGDSLIERVIAEYGEEWRALPRRTGPGLLAWVVPPLALVVGLGVVVIVLRRLRGPVDSEAEDLTDEERERLDTAMAEMEALEP